MQVFGLPAPLYDIYKLSEMIENQKMESIHKEIDGLKNAEKANEQIKDFIIYDETLTVPKNLLNSLIKNYDENNFKGLPEL